MIGLVVITEAMDARIRAFLRHIMAACKSCVTHSSRDCDGCVAPWAKNLMEDYAVSKREAELIRQGKEPKRGPKWAKMRRDKVLQVLRQAGRPLRFSEIDLHEFGSPSLKEWTLNRMVKNRMIGREFRGDCYLYFLVDKDQGNKTTKDDKQHGYEKGIDRDDRGQSGGTTAGALDERNELAGADGVPDPAVRPDQSR